MKLNEALKKSDSDDRDIQEDVFYLTGAIVSDPDADMFRYYHDPENPRSYLVINKNDVVGDVHPLTDSERNKKGFAMENVFRLGIKLGTKVKSVFISMEVIGETISAEMSNFPEAAGRCKHTTGCSSGCCTYGRDGKCYCDTCCVA